MKKIKTKTAISIAINKDVSDILKEKIENKSKYIENLIYKDLLENKIIEKKNMKFMPKNLTNEEFIAKAIMIHGDKYDYSLVEYKNALSKIKIVCTKHGIFEQRANSHYICGCQKCAVEKRGKKKRLKQNELIKSFIKIHGNKYDYSEVKYINKRNKIKIICAEHGIFEQLPLDHRNGFGCYFCGLNKQHNSLRKYDSWLKKCKEKFNNKYDYSLVNYISNRININIICPIHGIFEQTPLSHYKIGCVKCNYDNMMFNNKENFIKKSNMLHNNKYDYSLVEYKGNKIKVKIICPIHGVFEQKPDSHIIPTGCSICNESKGEKKIANFLDIYNINYIRQYKFENCKYKRKLPFDFYLTDYNCCIEFDGNQHFNTVIFCNGKSDYISTVRNDNIKNEYCKNNNIKLLRIKYTNYDNIELILSRFLKLLQHQ